MSISPRIILRLVGVGLLAVATGRFLLVGVSSFHTEESMPQNGNGFQIDHTVMIDHWAVLLGLVGALLVVSSFLIRPKTTL